MSSSSLAIVGGGARPDGDWFEEHEPVVRAFLCKRLGRLCPEDLADLTQEVFLRTLAACDRFRGEARFRTFVLGIANNVGREYLAGRRRRQRERDHALVTQEEIRRWAQAGRMAGGRDLMATVGRAMLRVSDRQREALWRVCVKGESSAELALELGISVKAVRRRVEAARDSLERNLGACESPCALRHGGGRCPASEDGSSCVLYDCLIVG